MPAEAVAESAAGSRAADKPAALNMVARAVVTDSARLVELKMQAAAAEADKTDAT
jgi:hypothetical protein